METANAVLSAGAGFKADRDLYKFLSADETGSLETDINPGSEAIVTGCMAGASVATAGASVAAGAGASMAGAWVAAGAPQAESTSPINNIAMKCFRDIKESFRGNCPPSKMYKNISQRIESRTFARPFFHVTLSGSEGSLLLN
jgi:hypothetical protein